MPKQMTNTDELPSPNLPLPEKGHYDKVSSLFHTLDKEKTS